MDSLLCDEDWLITPPNTPCNNEQNNLDVSCMDTFYTTRDDCKNAFIICLQKEVSYMPEFGYLDRLRSSNLLFARSKSVQFIIKCCSRLNLGLETVFNAVNCFDRYLSMNQSEFRIEGMIELISIACLSISAKFLEVSIPLFHQLQMDDLLSHSFQPNTIQKMELEILKALDWHLNCVTSYSYKELIFKLIDCDIHPTLTSRDIHPTLTSRVTEFLFDSLIDSKFVEFRPSIIAVSALQCSLEELLPSKTDAYLLNTMNFIPEDQRVHIRKCHKMMEERMEEPNGFPYLPLSPVTVIPIVCRVANYHKFLDFSTVNLLPLQSKKRKRGEDDTCK